ALKQLFPEVFTEGKIDFERLKQVLGEAVDSSRERYGLTWAGKSEAIKNIQTQSIGTLRPVPEESINFHTTENLIIEGENLEVLKLLQKSYYGKVKVIYIDPPYNTGKEFIYPDNYREGLEDYLRYTGKLVENGVKLSTNTETNGRHHSKWLNMMYPRLFLARNLLKENGVIFNSKNRQKFEEQKDNFKLPLSAEGFSNPDSDPRGPWKADPFDSPGIRPNLTYPIVNPNTGEEFLPPEGRCWRYGPDDYQRLLKDNRIVFGKSGRSKPQLKRFLYEAKEKGTTPKTLW